jgi:hypothetical protein
MHLSGVRLTKSMMSGDSGESGDLKTGTLQNHTNVLFFGVKLKWYEEGSWRNHHHH